VLTVGAYPRPGGETRIAVFGDADFASNRYLRALYNLDLLMNTIHWAAQRETEITLRPKSLTPDQYPLTPQQSLEMLYGVGLLIPELCVAAAAWTWVRGAAVGAATSRPAPAAWSRARCWSRRLPAPCRGSTPPAEHHGAIAAQHDDLVLRLVERRLQRRRDRVARHHRTVDRDFVFRGDRDGDASGVWLAIGAGRSTFLPCSRSPTS
jgi:hypothetical protein